MRINVFLMEIGLFYISVIFNTLRKSDKEIFNALVILIKVPILISCLACSNIKILTSDLNISSRCDILCSLRKDFILCTIRCIIILSLSFIINRVTKYVKIFM